MPLFFTLHFILVFYLVFLGFLVMSLSLVEKLCHAVVLALHEFIHMSFSLLLHIRV